MRVLNQSTRKTSNAGVDFSKSSNMSDFFSEKPIRILKPGEYAVSAVDVAPYLLGKVLLRTDLGQPVGGIITEVEAYQGEDDLGCHARAGLTPRTRVMYGPPGRAYIYFTYGMHWMLNAVTCAQGTPAAVLIRAIHPIYGLEQMGQFRPTRPKGWTDGPAKLCQALNLTNTLNGTDLCDPSGPLQIGDIGLTVPTDWVQTGPRVGLNHVPEPWKSIPWRWMISPEELTHWAVEQIRIQ